METMGLWWMHSQLFRVNKKLHGRYDENKETGKVNGYFKHLFLQHK